MLDHFGRTGVILRRVGRAPKRAILFQTPELFAKRLALFDVPAADLPRIEILARGQQLIAYGIHPDTERPYLWEPAGPMQVSAKQLPVITAKTADQFLADATLLLKRQCGWQLKSNPPKPATTSAPRGWTPYPHRFDVEAVRGILKVVTDAVEGNRNCALFWSTCRAGEMVRAGWFTRDAGIDVLLEAALKTGLSQHAALSTIRSGLRTVGV